MSNGTKRTPSLRISRTPMPIRRSRWDIYSKANHQSEKKWNLNFSKILRAMNIKENLILNNSRMIWIFPNGNRPRPLLS